MLIIASGIAVAALFLMTRSGPAVDSEPTANRLVRTFRAVPVTHRTALQSYGTSQADQEWTAVAEVSGRVTSIDEFFDDGEVLREGTLIATIDEQDYRLAFETAATEVAAQEQALLEIAQSKTNLESSIDVRIKQVEIAKAEVDRLQTLVDRNAGSKAEYDRAVSAYLDRDAALLTLRNELALIPIKKRSVETALTAAKLRQSQAERDIDRCQIRLPFTGFCVSRTAQLQQKVERGRELGRFISVARAQVLTMVEPRRAMMLFPKLSENIGTIDLRDQTSSLIREVRRQLKALDIPVDVTWRAGEGVAHWRGRLARASATVDESTRALPLIVEVDDAFSAIQVGVRPALVPGMFLEVTIYGDLIEDVFVVPREVVHDDQINVVRDGRLVIAPVHIRALEEELAVVDSGLEEGDQVVLVDLFPAANGMPLRTEEVPNPVKPRTEVPELPR